MPEIKLIRPTDNIKAFEKEVLEIASGSGAYDPHDVLTGQPVTMEGIVSRNANGYKVGSFDKNVFKYVRKGHVKTDEHWTRNWKRARLNYEGGKYVDHQ